MKKALIFGGTTEGRLISQTLSRNNIFCDVRVATEYGEQVLEESELLKVTVGRLGPEEIKALCDSDNYDVVIDATHPFATVVSENIRNNRGDRPLVRFERPVNKSPSTAARYFESAEQCAQELEKTPGKIFLTTGSKNLHFYCENPDVRKRLIVRVLPGLESLKLCYDAGLEGKQIIAVQGPFSTEMNRLQMREYGVSVMVTKESGKTGGVDEKLKACEMENVIPFIITNTSLENNREAISDYEVFYKTVGEITGVQIKSDCHLNIILAGIGPGNQNSMTTAVLNEINQADYIFGAQRMIDSIHSSAEKLPYYLAKDILPVLEKLQNEKQGDLKIVILFSGDTGFFSGQKKLRNQLETMENTSITILPGLSSIQVLSAKTGVDWQDAKIISMHGVEKEIWLPQLEESLSKSQKIFLLTSGCEDVQFLGDFIKTLGLENKYNIFIGYNLSYNDEEVRLITAGECCLIIKKGLYSVMLVPNQKEE